MPFGFGRKRKEGAARVRRKGGFGLGGPPENCICPRCGLVVPHEPGVPCYQRKCPQCGSFMARQFLETD